MDSLAAVMPKRKNTHIRFYLHKKFVIALLTFLRGAKVVSRVMIVMILVMTTPLVIIWRIFLRPITLLFYRLNILLRERIRRYFYAQHKLLALIAHRFAIHTVVIIMTILIATINFAHAHEVRAQEFGKGSLVEKIFRGEEESTITAQSTMHYRTRYIDTSTSVRATQRLTNIDTSENEESVAVTGGTSLVKVNALGDDNPIGRTETYTIQAGDTVSTIAQDFGVSTDTILWANNLTENSVIRPGMTLTILPTSGISHTVTSGETVTSIAKEFNAKPEDIIEYNNLIDGSEIIIGMNILVPGGRKITPPAPSIAPSRPTTRLASLGSVFGGTPPPNAPAPTNGRYRWPTTCTRISQYFGYRHTGIDIDCELGNTIFAAESGTVIDARWATGYGLEVVIQHAGGIKTRYGHMQKIFVSRGQTVSKGQSIGEMGSTGWSTGSHLHFETIINGNQFVNPYNYL